MREDDTRKRGDRIVASQMQLADVVSLADFDSDFSTCIVKQIDKNEVTLFRPYGTTVNFESTGGVICYIGIEEYKIFNDSKTEYILRDSKYLR